MHNSRPCHENEEDFSEHLISINVTRAFDTPKKLSLRNAALSAPFERGQRNSFSTHLNENDLRKVFRLLHALHSPPLQKIMPAVIAAHPGRDNLPDMTSSIVSNSRYIATKSRGLLEFLSFGLCRRSCLLDFRKRTVVVTTTRFWRREVVTFNLDEFDQVENVYDVLGYSYTRYGNITHEHGEYEVSLRFKDGSGYLPIAKFHGTTGDKWQADGLLGSQIPLVPHEMNSRSFASRICERIGLRPGFR